MKLVVITSRYPYPVEKGDKLRVYHQLKYLSEYHDVLLISLTDEVPTTHAKEEIWRLGIESKHYTIPKFKRWLSAAIYWLNGRPAQVGYFLDGSIKRAIYRDILDFQPDRIYCQLIRVAEYVRSLPYVKVLDYMDCLSAGWLRQSRYQTGMKRWMYAVEGRFLRKYERDVYADFDACTIISTRDRDDMPLLSKELIQVVPNGIDVSHFMPKSGDKKRYDVAFIGNLGYAPNEQAVLTLKSWYEEENWSDVSVYITGARPTPQILQIRFPQWKISGWVDDIREAYCSANIFVAPLFTGSGLQNKILEAMACGLPCITTSLVNESIGADDGHHLIIADDKRAFGAAIRLLKGNEALRKRIGENARAFVVNQYQWAEFNTKLNMIIKNVESKSTS